MFNLFVNNIWNIAMVSFFFTCGKKMKKNFKQNVGNQKARNWEKFLKT